MNCPLPGVNPHVRWYESVGQKSPDYLIGASSSFLLYSQITDCVAGYNPAADRHKTQCCGSERLRAEVSR